MFEGIKRMFKKKDSNINPESLAGQSLENADLYRQSATQVGIDPSTLAGQNLGNANLYRQSASQGGIDPSAYEGQSLGDVDLYNVNEQEETVKHR